MTNRDVFRLLVEVNADEPGGLRQVLEAAIPGAQILEVEGGFHVEGTLRGDSARDKVIAIHAPGSAARALLREWTQDSSPATENP